MSFNETEFLQRVTIRLLLEHERPRFDQLIEESIICTRRF